MNEHQKTNIVRDTLIYSCSGCSSAAQMANAIAVQIDRAGIAEMSCIAGIGGHIKSLVNKAISARAIVVLDGCPLHCAKNCLREQHLAPTRHYDLSKMGVEKEYRCDFDTTQKETLFRIIAEDILINLFDN